MRTSKYVGFLAIGLGALLMVGAAILPVSPATQRLGPFRVDIRQEDNCGPALTVAARDAATDCRTAARKRLLATSGVGLLIVALGMALFVGEELPHRSRVDVPTPRLRRRVLLRSPGSRRYRPG